MAAAARGVMLMRWRQTANHLFCRPQALQSAKDNISPKDADGQGADLLNVPAAGAEIAGGQIQSYRENKDKEDGADALQQAAEKGHHPRRRQALLIGAQVGRHDKFTVSRSDGVQHAIEKGPHQQPDTAAVLMVIQQQKVHHQIAMQGNLRGKTPLDKGVPVRMQGKTGKENCFTLLVILHLSAAAHPNPFTFFVLSTIFNIVNVGASV